MTANLPEPAHLLLVSANGGLPARLRMLRPGTRTAVMLRMSAMSGLREPTGNREIVVLADDASPAEWVRVALALHDSAPFTGIAATSERDQDKAAAIAAAIEGLQWHPETTITAVYDKLEMRSRLSAAGVEHHPASQVKTAQDIVDFGSTYGWPVVVKPTGGTASLGVTVVQDAKDAERALSRTDVHEAFAPWGSGPITLMAESFLTGEEISVEAFSDDGVHQVIAITGKLKEPRNSVEIGHVLPLELDPQLRSEVIAAVEATLDALGVRFGPTHTEMMLTPNGPRVVETHTRPGGDDIVPMLAEALGVDIELLVARQTLGEPVLPLLRQTLSEADPEARSAVWFTSAPSAGILVEMNGDDEVRKLDGVRDVTLLHEEGSEVSGELESSFDRCASVRVSLRGSSAEAVELARDAAQRLRFVVRAPGID